MKLTIIGNVVTRSTNKDTATFQIAYEAQTNGKNGTALLIYKYDKRSVINETVMTTPEIADEMKDYLGDYSPMAMTQFTFPNTIDENKNTDKAAEATEICTVQVYGNN